MKKEQSIISVLGLISVAAIIWAIQLNGTCNSLKSKKIELEEKLTKAIKDRDFIRVQLDDLEKKLESEKRENINLSEQLDEARVTIEEFRREIISLTQARQTAEDELGSLKKNNSEEITKSVDVAGSQAATLPETPGATQEMNLPIQDIVPLSQ